MADRRFAKLSSSVTSFQVHASDDSRFAIVPVYEQTSIIKGWVVYDSIAGEIIHDSDSLTSAREWINSNYPTER